MPILGRMVGDGECELGLRGKEEEGGEDWRHPWELISLNIEGYKN